MGKSITVSALPALIVSAFTLATSSCSSPSPQTLSVQLRTDMVAGIEFSLVRTELFEGALGAEGTAYRVLDDQVPAQDADLISGLTLGAFENVEPEVVTVRVSLLDGSGESVVARPVQIKTADLQSVTIVITRDCQNVTCPGPDDPILLACLSGACVDPRCSPETPELCGQPSCTEDSDCGSEASCAVGQCLAGSCLFAAVASSCDDGLWCNPDSGCTAIVADPPRLLSPLNGTATGSLHTPNSFAGVHPLRPVFRWSEVKGVDHYQFQLSDECSVSGFTDCAFANPTVELDLSANTTQYTPDANLEVSNTAPVGRRYFWRVRSCLADSCSEWSMIHYLDVGRIASDYNGDGYADLLVGASLFDYPQLDEGNAFVYYGTSSGFDAYVTTPSSAQRLDNPDTSGAGQFGAAVAALGDVNGDGYADAVIGAESQSYASGDLAEGNAFLYLGSATGLSSTPSLRFTNPDPIEESRFGGAVAGAGDVNADGFADILISASDYTNATTATAQNGKAYLYHGAQTISISTPSSTLTIPESTTISLFGFSVASAGDINADGFIDLIIGAPQEDQGAGGEGNAFIFMGGKNGITKSSMIRLDNPDNEADSGFGHCVRYAGDVNNDGFSDVAIGMPYQIDNSVTDPIGQVIFYYGGANGIATTPAFRLHDPDSQFLASFGASFAPLGDSNGDGNVDFIVGTYEYEDNYIIQGKAHIFSGNATVYTDSPSLVMDNPSPMDDSQFAVSVANLGDVNGDGYADLAVGAMGHNNDGSNLREGNVFIYYGSATGFTATPSVQLDNPDDQADSFFGVSVAALPF
ncbi:MAG: VCBS repeat-containing protein [Myxococcales bacterium]|nr:MAG: VCBS repeat-containing protein [Myxococcales bacterium]